MSFRCLGSVLNLVSELDSLIKQTKEAEAQTKMLCFLGSGSNQVAAVWIQVAERIRSLHCSFTKTITNEARVSDCCFADLLFFEPQQPNNNPTTTKPQPNNNQTTTKQHLNNIQTTIRQQSDNNQTTTTAAPTTTIKEQQQSNDN